MFFFYRLDAAILGSLLIDFIELTEPSFLLMSESDYLSRFYDDTIGALVGRLID